MKVDANMAEQVRLRLVQVPFFTFNIGRSSAGDLGALHLGRTSTGDWCAVSPGFMCFGSTPSKAAMKAAERWWSSERRERPLVEVGSDALSPLESAQEMPHVAQLISERLTAMSRLRSDADRRQSARDQIAGML